MTETVTYRGATDGTESDAFVIPPPAGDQGETFRFPLDIPVEKVPSEVVEQVKAADGHIFDVGALASKPGEPYTGYDDLEAKDIVERLEASNDPDLASTVADYEADHKGRKTVLEAAQAVETPEVTQGP